MMSRIRNKDTKPELIVRKGLHAMGYRYRLHDRRLAGKPDLVFRSRRAVIFINGCFWHGHDCHLFKWPNSRAEWWKAKISRNREKDAQNLARLTSANWRVLTVWECALKGKKQYSTSQLLNEIAEWLEGSQEKKIIRG